MQRDDPFQLLGATIDDRYHVEAFAGAGRSGFVYRALERGVERSVAIKLLTEGGEWTMARRDAIAAAVRDEAELVRAISASHAGFARMLDMAFLDLPYGPIPYLVSEWLEGEPLERHLDRRREAQLNGRPLPEMFARLTPIAEALGRAHAQFPPVAHLAVRPSNIFLARTPSGPVAKLTDLTPRSLIAPDPALQDPDERKLAPSAFRYLTPEQWRPKFYGDTGPRTDVHALAVVAAEMWSDRPGLDGDTAKDLRAAVVDPKHRPTPRARGTNASPGVELVFEKAVSVRPGDRYRDASAFWSALRDAGRIVDLPPEFQAPASVRAGNVPRPPPPPARSMGAFAVLVVLLTLIAGAAAATYAFVPDLRPQMLAAIGMAPGVPTTTARAATGTAAGEATDLAPDASVSATADDDDDEPPPVHAAPSTSAFALAAASASAATSASAAAGPKAFDLAVALASLNAPSAAAKKCKKDDAPASGKIKISFAPAGNVLSINVLSGLGGGVADCVAAAFLTTRVPPFTGRPASVTRTIVLE